MLLVADKGQVVAVHVGRARSFPEPVVRVVGLPRREVE